MRRVAHLLVAIGGVLSPLAGAEVAFADVPATSLPALTRVSGDSARVANGADAAVNAAGQAVIGWAEVPLDQPGRPKSTGAMVSFRSAAGTWSAPERVSSTAYNARGVHVAIDAAGTATVAWTEAPDYHRETVHVVRHSDAGFADAQSWAPPTGGANAIDLAVDAAGDAVLVWTGYDLCDVCASYQGTGDIWVATRSGDTPFGPEEQVSTPTRLYRGGPAAAIVARGDVAVAWQEGANPDDQHVVVRRRPAGGTFAAPLDFPVGHVARTAPGVIVAPGGETTLAWWRERSMQVARIGADGAVASTGSLAGYYATPFPFGRASLAVDDAGRVTAAWVANDGLWTSTAAPGGDLLPAVKLDGFASTSAGPPGVAADPAGGAVVSWVSDGALRAAWRPAGETTFRQVRTLRGTGEATGTAAALAGGHLLLATSLASGSEASSIFATAGVPDAIAPPAPTVVPPADTLAPKLTIGSVSVAPKRAARRSGSHRTRRRLQVVVGSSEAAQVVTTVTRRAPGVRRGQRCAAPGHGRKSKRRRSCTRTIVVGRPVTSAVPEGSTTIVLGPAPRPGTYEVAVTGRDAAGNLAAPVTRRVVIH